MPRSMKGGKVTHGRHCTCSACAREDWTNPKFVCGMHGESCPAVYAPLGPAGVAVAAVAREQFFDDVRAVVADHWSGLPEHRPDEAVWARLDAVLFDDEGISRVEPDFEAKP